MSPGNTEAANLVVWCEGERGMSSLGGGGRTLLIALASDPSAFKASLTILTWIHKLSVPELLSRSDQTQTDSLPQFGLTRMSQVASGLENSRGPSNL